MLALAFKLLLALTGTMIIGLEFHGTHDHILRGADKSLAFPVFLFAAEPK
jgi:hypothetical protein